MTFADAAARINGNAVAEPGRIELTGLRLGVQGLDWRGERRAAPHHLSSQQRSARIRAPRRGKAEQAGALGDKGRVGMNPVLVDSSLRVQPFPVHLFAPYFADQARLTLLRAEARDARSVALRQLPARFDVNLAGDLLLGDAHVASLPDSTAWASVDSTDEILSSQALAPRGVKLTMKPKARPQVEVGEVALGDFHSRLIATERGRFNLQEVAAAPIASSAPANASALAGAASPATSPATSRVTSSENLGLHIDIALGIAKLANGRIDFTDRFERPGYSAACTELSGQIDALGSDRCELATLDPRDGGAAPRCSKSALR